MLRVVSLQDLINNFSNDEIKIILSEFKSVPKSYGKINDVEHFLFEKSILFENMGLSTTHLIFNSDNMLLGYFSLANKPLIMSKKNYNLLSNNKKKKLFGYGSRDYNDNFIINAYLIGQLGKNYKYKDKINGKDILSFAYRYLLEAKRYVNSRFVWLECEDNPKLLDFYKNFGFEEVDKFESKNELKVLIMRLKE